MPLWARGCSTSASSGDPVELTATTLRELASRHGITPSKAMGQNFVIDQNTLRRIVRLAEVDSQDRVIEVGPGFGSLTVELARSAAEVVAVEFDRKLSGPLSEVLHGKPNVRLVWGDALTQDWDALTKGDRWKLVANLPYNIATPLLAKILDEAPGVEDMTLMVQKEVGERWVTRPGSKTYGGISVLVAFHCEAHILGTVPPTVFWPRPKISSVLVRLTRRRTLEEADPSALMRVVRWSFGHRRKTIRNALVTGSGKSPTDVEEALTAAGIDPSARAEQLDLESFVALSRILVR